MLGEQLIKNERVALVELVKNAYDADASRVTVDFRGFASDFAPLPGATIVITDDGVGMTETLVRTAWMNPATPSKALQKKNEPTTSKDRVLQGEKGIGRFATFKLGSEVTLVCRARDHDDEVTLFVDISALDEGTDDERLDLDPEFYLEQIPALMETGPPNVFDGTGVVGSTHGTQLEISRIRAAWSERLVRGAFDDLARLQPLMWAADGSGLRPDFEVFFLKDGAPLPYREERGEDFEDALVRAVMVIRNGRFDDSARRLSFELDGREVVLNIDDAEVRGLKPFKDRFLKDSNNKDLPADTIPAPACGPFGFEFFVFDLTSSAPARYSLDKDQVKLIKAHRIYLYRDGIRVYPYGDPHDDWLEIDADRGTESAGRTLSNDQTVGYVTITQVENPNLKDKTSREGLIESGRAIDDFKALIKTVLRYVRKRYQPYLDSKERTRSRDLQTHRIDRYVQEIRKQTGLSAKVVKQLDALEVALTAERELFSMQIARTEQLAGVGLSVETASHDLILAGSEALRTSRHIVSELRLLDLLGETVYALATQLVARLDFINSRFKDVQGLFVSTRQRPTEQNVVGIARRVRSIYDRLHREKDIEFQIDTGAALRAPSTEAAVLQLLINLVDNATYWLLASPHTPRTIRVFTPDTSTLVVTDNGPGVKEEDAPFIFEPFYSGKGEEGKGLGLYIARQNGLRNGFSIDLRASGDPRDLAGATFVVRFGEMSGGDVNP
jgi:signal transduction histidine kinase